MDRRVIWIICTMLFICTPVYSAGVQMLGCECIGVESVEDEATGGSIGCIGHDDTSYRGGDIFSYTVFTATAGPVSYAHIYTNDTVYGIKRTVGVYTTSGSKVFDVSFTCVTGAGWHNVALSSSQTLSSTNYIVGFVHDLSGTTPRYQDTDHTGSYIWQLVMTHADSLPSSIVTGDAVINKTNYQLTLVLNNSAGDPE